MGRNTTVPADKITVNLARQVRAGIDHDLVDEYARLDKEGVELPRVDLFVKPDSQPVEYILVDGDARVEACHKNKKADAIPATVHEGTPEDAVLFAVQANATHGRQRSPADKRKAVKLLMDQPGWAAKSDRAIADQCKVSHHVVAQVREELKANTDGKRVNKKGRSFTAKKKRKKGAVLFEFTEPIKSLGNLLKTVDDVVEVYPDEKKSGDYRLVKQAGDKFFELFQAWSKRLMKIKPD